MGNILVKKKRSRFHENQILNKQVLDQIFRVFKVGQSIYNLTAKMYWYNYMKIDVDTKVYWFPAKGLEMFNLGSYLSFSCLLMIVSSLIRNKNKYVNNTQWANQIGMKNCDTALRIWNASVVSIYALLNRT